MSLIYRVVKFFYLNIIKKIPGFHKTVYIFGGFLVSVISKIKHFETVENDSLGFRFELVTGIFERRICNVIKKYIRPGMTVLDIGAHVGYYTQIFSKLVGSGGKVIAFEPHPKTFLVLRSNVGNLSNVILVPSGVADRETTAELKDFLQSCYSSLFYDAIFIDRMKTSLKGACSFPRVIQNIPTATYKVNITSVDAYLNQLGVNNVDFIKMDIEGSEMAAIRGMNRTLKSSLRMRMVMEFNPRTLSLSGTAPIEVWDSLRTIGFSIGEIQPDGIKIWDRRESVLSLIEELERKMDDVILLCWKENDKVK